MSIRIAVEDPAGADIVALLQDGEAHAAALYPAERNHFLGIESLRAPSVHFIVARTMMGRRWQRPPWRSMTAGPS